MPGRISYILVTILMLWTCASCKRSLGTVDYAKYVNNSENGLKRDVRVDGWEFSILYRPYDYVMLMENKGDTRGYDFNKRKSELEGTAWFSISMKRIDNSVIPLRYEISSLEEYNTRLNYYLNEASQDIKLVYGDDTLRPASYLFENNFNLTPQQTMLAGFILPKGDKCPKKGMTLSFVDEIFKNGIITAGYSEKTLTSTPNLIY